MGVCRGRVCYLHKGNFFPVLGLPRKSESSVLFFFFFNTMEVMNTYNKMEKKNEASLLGLPSGENRV